ncbi:hypothetical protein RND71_007995 [Anisodus tanguticus]|uniref:Uncharacterized protein n=1 Tax=Anisodus tanguticus TaxID=243964 RepID=A0AAE1VQ88_9SOLA|nr:hypothetical protein RND71_007995 [Anisodus tanguticus]
MGGVYAIQRHQSMCRNSIMENNRGVYLLDGVLTKRACYVFELANVATAEVAQLAVDNMEMTMKDMIPSAGSQSEYPGARAIVPKEVPCLNTFDTLMDNVVHEINPTTPKMVVSNQDVLNVLKEKQFATMVNTILVINPCLVTLNTSTHNMPLQLLESVGEQQGDSRKKLIYSLKEAVEDAGNAIPNGSTTELPPNNNVDTICEVSFGRFPPPYGDVKATIEPCAQENLVPYPTPIHNNEKTKQRRTILTNPLYQDEDMGSAFFANPLYEQTMVEEGVDMEFPKDNISEVLSRGGNELILDLFLRGLLSTHQT